MILIICLNLLASFTWYEAKLEGWYYFEESPLPDEAFSAEEAHEMLTDEKERLQEMLSLALLFPNRENVAKYIEQHEQWSKQSLIFADTWDQVLSERPNADD